MPGLMLISLGCLAMPHDMTITGGSSDYAGRRRQRDQDPRRGRPVGPHGPDVELAAVRAGARERVHDRVVVEPGHLVVDAPVARQHSLLIGSDLEHRDPPGTV